MSTNSVKTTKITIQKKDGLTHALKRLVESMPNSIISDGKITRQEWDATIDKLIEINNKRIEEGKKNIFSGNTDRNDFKRSFVVHTGQEIEFTENEISQLFEAMGVSISDQKAPEKEKDKDKEEEIKKNEEKNAPETKTPAPSDSTKVAPKQTIASINNNEKIEEAKDTKKTRFSLSWGEIGTQALKSTGNFFKGMFCDENGFSIKRTAATVGIAAGTAAIATVSAPLALAIGAGFGVYMLYQGGKNLIKGSQEYLKAQNHDEAAAAMEKAMDGGIEAGMGIAALFGVKKGAAKTSSKSTSKPNNNTNSTNGQNSTSAPSSNNTSRTPEITTETAAQKPAPESTTKPTSTSERNNLPDINEDINIDICTDSRTNKTRQTSETVENKPTVEKETKPATETNTEVKPAEQKPSEKAPATETVNNNNLFEFINDQFQLNKAWVNIEQIGTNEVSLSIVKDLISCDGMINMPTFIELLLKKNVIKFADATKGWEWFKANSILVKSVEQIKPTVLEFKNGQWQIKEAAELKFIE